MMAGICSGAYWSFVSCPQPSLQLTCRGLEPADSPSSSLGLPSPRAQWLGMLTSEPVAWVQSSPHHFSLAGLGNVFSFPLCLSSLTYKNWGSRRPCLPGLREDRVCSPSRLLGALGMWTCRSWSPGRASASPGPCVTCPCLPVQLQTPVSSDIGGDGFRGPSRSNLSGWARPRCSNKALQKPGTGLVLPCGPCHWRVGWAPLYVWELG